MIAQRTSHQGPADPENSAHRLHLA